MKTKAAKVAAVLVALALVVGTLGTMLYRSTPSWAAGDAKSLCSNLALAEFDARHGASYDTETLITGYRQDLAALGYDCEDGEVAEVTTITVDSDMHPTVTAATCDTDGELVLPEVEHTTWQSLVDNDLWEPITTDAEPGTYRVRLMPDEGYTLNRSIVTTLNAKPQLDSASDECSPADEVDNQDETTPQVEEIEEVYECRTSGLNGLPEFIALMPGKLGQYAYGEPFTGTTVDEARQHIYDQSWCDPVWMMQKYREYVDPDMTAEQAHAKVVELIGQVQDGQHDEWDSMIDEIMESFDRSEHSFETLDPGRYHSLGMVTDTTDGIPRVVGFIVNDTEAQPVLRSKVTYDDGTKRTLNLRLACNLQERTHIPTEQTVTAGPATVPLMQDLPRNEEGDIVPEVPATPAPTAPPTTPAQPTTPPTAPPTTPAPEPTGELEDKCQGEEANSPECTTLPPGLEMPTDNEAADTAEPSPVQPGETVQPEDDTADPGNGDDGGDDTGDDDNDDVPDNEGDDAVVTGGPPEDCAVCG